MSPSEIWPWLGVAGVGALHGLNPASGWAFAAARGLRSCDARQARRALLPIAVGHLASVAAVACALANGLWLDRAPAQLAAGALLVAAAARRCLRADTEPPPMHAEHGSQAALAGWSFLMGTAHGAGMMLVPALVPLCLASDPARAITASGSLWLALAAVAVHAAAMLLVASALAAGVCRWSASHPRAARGLASRRWWTGALAAGGVLLIASR